MSKLKQSDIAPPFDLPVSNEKQVALKDFLGKKNVVLYFYPKDDTPGCTIEACEFRDSIKRYHKINAVVLGLSPDGVNRHQKFIEKFNLPFLLLSDEEKNVLKEYGVWVKKNMYGRTYWGVARTTFVIDQKGRIVKIFDNVKPKDHSQEVLDVLKSL